ncbi:MAG: dTDP-4-dehydrorhamnose 3,5-epimerase [Crocinitomicaceae bacterium]|nr:dTDP-4-dehydrorhamnose 3,5-epimerase [Crocinitomicaceae bacterium]
MEVISFNIEGLLAFQPRVFGDDRGYFFEPFNKKNFSEHLVGIDFVQDNESCSKKNVVRGLHFQKPPFAQGKLVRVVKGAVIDIAVDIRKNSATYGHYQRIELSEHNKTIFWIPEGFAHGFVALEDDTIFSYKCSNYYDQPSEDSILWNDKDLNIDWGVAQPIISDKDAIAQNFNTFNSPF